MPYISRENRNKFDYIRDPINEDFYFKMYTELRTTGELNYVITDILDSQLIVRGGVNYQNINEMIGVLECVKLELYRRVAAPYEDKKMQENGDVFTVKP